MIAALVLAFSGGHAGEIEREGQVMASLLAGVWSNAAQYEAADESLKRPPAAGHPYDWLDLQHARFVSIDTPHIPGDAVYLEWREGGPDGPVSRQRLWVFHSEILPDESPLTGMDFYTFRDPAAFEGRTGWEDFTDLTPDDLIGYPQACQLRPVSREGGETVLAVDEADCVITAQSGRTMGISARVSISFGRIAYSESGRLEDGEYAFKVPGAGAYHFERVWN
ncbi:hypothetical protein F1654_04570 [Alkalicaulis satelles]|uniref:Uncharacterized protein n=1 Tax=Alkalicaulis satelles TaxID=2609175 RepID=A0A5M6ZPS7_9PROT|nr:hypothetical protein [Alkalicaulis satelles]KAA5805258.1 hypothetical protein F1654_04570 [Alkalicaulis satelles]